MEGFASAGGTLPKQVWDEEDIPEKHLRFGRYSGSAMPLVWAHAEYAQLLRSATDGEVFDFNPVVADRYRNDHGRKDLEIWKPNRRARNVTAGMTLRIQAPAYFRLRWRFDEAPAKEADAVDSHLGIHYVDIATETGQRGTLSFWFEELPPGTCKDWQAQKHRVEIGAAENTYAKV
jgi:glucoamylase